MAKLTPDHLRELGELRSVCDTIIELMGKYEDLGKIGLRMQAAIEDAVTLQNVRGMRTIARDLRALMAAVQPAQRAEIEREVLRRTGLELAAVPDADQLRIARVVERGRIVNEGEYHLLRARIDEISGDLVSQAEARQLQALVDAFAV